LQCDLTDGVDETITYTKRYDEASLQRMSEAAVSDLMVLKMSILSQSFVCSISPV